MEHGAAELEVVVNGIASEPIRVNVWPFLLHFHIDEAAVNTLIGSLADGPLRATGAARPGSGRPLGTQHRKGGRGSPRFDRERGARAPATRQRGASQPPASRPLRRRDRTLARRNKSGRDPLNRCRPARGGRATERRAAGDAARRCGARSRWLAQVRGHSPTPNDVAGPKGQTATRSSPPQLASDASPTVGVKAEPPATTCGGWLKSKEKCEALIESWRRL